ncbi:MAG: hypothetical protein SFU83_10300 [Meiothermus sp.]|nr:hypothetical protein [Meiothermus sp.]
MMTTYKINALPETQVWEGLREGEDAALRVVIRHTSPSHYEALAQVRSGAQSHHPRSGPMTADLLLQWLETLLAGQTVTWTTHDEDEATRRFVHQVREANAVT